MNRAALLLAVYAAWGLLYLWRTSFQLGGERIFVLWDERVQGISNLGVTLAETPPC